MYFNVYNCLEKSPISPAKWCHAEDITYKNIQGYDHKHALKSIRTTDFQSYYGVICSEIDQVKQIYKNPLCIF